jgi:alkylated DNA repair dioxygenase AlkB
MNLFSNGIISNLLPYDAEVIYYGKIFDQASTTKYLHSLLENIEWKNDEAVIFGKRIITKRKTAWYGDKGYSYTYSNISRNALAWTKELLELKQVAEERTGAKYNSCLLNLYHNGDEGVSWHSDDEVTLEKGGHCIDQFWGRKKIFLQT